MNVPIRLRCQRVACLLVVTGCVALTSTAFSAPNDLAPRVEVVGEMATVESPAPPVVPDGGDLIGPTAPPRTLASSASPELAIAPADMSGPPPAVVAVPTAASPAPMTPSQNVTINLINRLVERGVLTKEDSTELIRQAEEDAVKAKAQVASQQLAAASSAPAGTAPADGTVRVTYVPEVVKAQIREDIKQDVLKQARNENWAAPRTFPDWVSRFHFNGDVRVRYEGIYFPSDNDNVNRELAAAGRGDPSFAESNFWNYNSLNTSGTPFDVASSTNPPYNNVDQNRDRLRLRSRFGVDVDIGSGFSTGMRLATGDSSSPVSQNQSLGGTTNNSGGNFSKYAIWLDRGFIKYDIGKQPEKSAFLTVGRFDNPFFGTSMIWADDLGFDGFAAKGRYQVADGIIPFMTVGAFPVYNTDLNFSSNQGEKFSSRDKWLYAAQMGSDFKINKEINLKVAAAYYHFQNVEGKVSSPFSPADSSVAGDTDNSRPSFAQKGNTYIALREIAPDAAINANNTTNQWQYFGLATPYQDVALTARLDLSHFDPFHIWMVGEYVKNVAFDRADIQANGPKLNPDSSGPLNNIDKGGTFAGGDMGYNVTLNLGCASLEKLWDWNVSLGYRYVESDAVIDGFCDSDFGGGGTNLKGFVLGGKLALSKHVWTGARWLSADSIAGPSFKEDILQFDINAKF